MIAYSEVDGYELALVIDEPQTDDGRRVNVVERPYAASAHNPNGIGRV
jgi:hypothetical protein